MSLFHVAQGRVLVGFRGEGRQGTGGTVDRRLTLAPYDSKFARNHLRQGGGASR